MLLSMNVAEIFTSINGEGQRAGELALFVRFTGCNLRCSYCDTLWACDKRAPHMNYTVKDIVKRAIKEGVHNVTLTGGEPLLQPEIAELIQTLLENNFFVEIETNGAVPILPVKLSLTLRPSFTMDYKLPSSGMEVAMRMDNFSLLTMRDTVKFVCGSLEDMERAKKIIDRYNLLTETNVYFSPVFGKINPQDMVEFMKQHKINRARLQLQLHKFIWDPQERGV